MVECPNGYGKSITVLEDERATSPCLRRASRQKRRSGWSLRPSSFRWIRLERRRSERSGKPFVLMLIDGNDLFEATGERQVSRRSCGDFCLHPGDRCDRMV